MLISQIININKITLFIWEKHTEDLSKRKWCDFLLSDQIWYIYNLAAHTYQTGTVSDLTEMLADIGREFQIGHSDVRQVDFSLTTVNFSINKTRDICSAMSFFRDNYTILNNIYIGIPKKDDNRGNLLLNYNMYHTNQCEGYITYKKHIVVYVHNFYYIFTYIFLTVLLKYRLYTNCK